MAGFAEVRSGGVWYGAAGEERCGAERLGTVGYGSLGMLG